MTKTEPAWLRTARLIVDTCSYKHIDPDTGEVIADGGAVFDTFTASIVVQVNDKINESNRDKLWAMTPMNAIDTCVKVSRKAVLS